MYLVDYLIKCGFKLLCIFRVDKNNRSGDCFLKVLSKPKMVHERLEEKHINKVQSAWWESDDFRVDEEHACLTTVRGISLQQFILMALSVIVLETYRGDPSCDHTPTTRSNHQHLRLRLQHSGDHGGGRLLPCEHNKSLDWQDRRLQFRHVNVRRTRRKSLVNAISGVPLNDVNTGVHQSMKGIYSTLKWHQTAVNVQRHGCFTSFW